MLRIILHPLILREETQKKQIIKELLDYDFDGLLLLEKEPRWKVFVYFS